MEAGGAGHKLLATMPDGRTVVATSVSTPRVAGMEVCVVTGAADLGDVLPADVHIVHNDRWADGQATSLAAALEWADQHDFDAVVVGLGDQPWVGIQAWSAVADRVVKGIAEGLAPIVVPTFAGRRGQPVGLRREVWSALPTEGDAGARILIAQAPELVDEFPCGSDQQLLNDIDTPGDLSSWN